MGNKAVLNITKFSLGDTSSMVSLLLPTEETKQDMTEYKAFTDIGSLEDLLKGFAHADDASPTAKAVVNYLSDMGIEFTDAQAAREQFLEYYSLYEDLMGFNALVSWLQRILSKTERMYDEGVPALKAELLAAIAEDIGVALDAESEEAEFYTRTKDKISHLANRLPDNASEEKLDNLNAAVQDALQELSDSVTEMERVRRMREIEGVLPEFYHFLICVMNPNARDELENRFKAFQSVVNGELVRRWAKNAVEYPYLLDLGFDKAGQVDELSDTDGATMHTLQREPFNEEGWDLNHLRGDKLRIRDMFRIDKLNKISAYESVVLNPGHTGLQLDKDLEMEDVISRLMENENDVNGVVGMTSTTQGLYVLTEATDASSISLKGTAFSTGEDGIYSTNTFRSYKIPFAATDNYLSSLHLSPQLNLLRAFGPKSEKYSSGSDFLTWFEAHFDKALVKKAGASGDESVLRIVGRNSYVWCPVKKGIRYLKGIYSKDQYNTADLKDVSYQLPPTGMEIIAGLADDNYEAQVPRKAVINIPYSSDGQHSYLTFSVTLELDENLPIAGREISIEFSLDDGTPMRFFLLSAANKDPENITENNELYESIRDYDPAVPSSKRKYISPAGVPTDFQFIIENDLTGGNSKQFHIAVTANFPPLGEIVASEDVIRSYENTFVKISRPEITSLNRECDLSYGTYNEETNNAGGSVNDYWNLSRAIKDAEHQFVLEIPHSVKTVNSRKVYSNYPTATLFSDIITTKSYMDSEYRTQASEDVSNVILDRLRRYTGMDSCSDTISLYFDAETTGKAQLAKDNADENLGQEYSMVDECEKSEHYHATDLRYKRIETIKAINRFSHTMKHKSNLFSVNVRNSMTNEALIEAEGAVTAAEDDESRAIAEENLEKVKADVNNVRLLITNAIEQICLKYAPAHNQLFKVYFD